MALLAAILIGRLPSRSVAEEGKLLFPVTSAVALTASGTPTTPPAPRPNLKAGSATGFG
jgi:hypothetical protein